ncbi:hypothetical protein, partial [Neobacillus niacini]|uniref:hypothetical protein n=1 Tax=Neobacillus niacini TaxID=86668 RepID=UPI00286CE514
ARAEFTTKREKKSCFIAHASNIYIEKGKEKAIHCQCERNLQQKGKRKAVSLPMRVTFTSKRGKKRRFIASASRIYNKKGKEKLFHCPCE